MKPFGCLVRDTVRFRESRRKPRPRDRALHYGASRDLPDRPTRSSFSPAGRRQAAAQLARQIREIVRRVQARALRREGGSGGYGGNGLTGDTEQRRTNGGAAGLACRATVHAISLESTLSAARYAIPVRDLRPISVSPFLLLIRFLRNLRFLHGREEAECWLEGRNFEPGSENRNRATELRTSEL